MVERIREILQANQLTPTQFADSIGVARPIISHILSGRNKPSLEVVQKILAAFPQLSLDWLLKGAGSMLADAPGLVLAPTTSAPQIVAATATPVTAPAPVAVEQSPVQKAVKAPRYRPQPVSPTESRQEAVRAVVGPSGYPPPASLPNAVDAAPPAASLPAVPAKQANAFDAGVAAGAVAPVAAATPAAAVGAMAGKAGEAPPAPPLDTAIASAFADPGKVIRRIVIFYQDGTFTDYQPELRG